MSLLDPPGTRAEATVEPESVTPEPAEPAPLEPASQGLYVSLLGRFGIQVDGVSLSLRGDRRRALLATLLLNSGRVVPTGDLIARVWDTPGQAARGALQVHIARARALFEQRDVRGEVAGRHCELGVQAVAVPKVDVATAAEREVVVRQPHEGHPQRHVQLVARWRHMGVERQLVRDVMGAGWAYPHGDQGNDRGGETRGGANGKV